MSILIFFAVLFVLILVHEWGHFIVAKKTGMRVDEFGIGFPPKLYGIKRGETEYTFNALPIGGFVKIWGENGEEPFSPVESEASDRRSEASAEAGEGGTKLVSMNQSIGKTMSPVESEASDRRSEASAEAGEGGTKLVSMNQSIGKTMSPVESEAGEGGVKSGQVDYSRSFGNRPKWAQALVLIAGVTMNVLFAWFLFSLTYMIGVPTPVDEATASEAAELYVAGTLPESPAAVIPAGSVVNSISYNETVIDRPTPTNFSDLVQTAAPNAIQVTYRYDDQEQVVDLQPVQGLVAEDASQYIVGASLSLVEIQRTGFFSAIKDGFVTTYSAFADITVGLFSLIKQAFVGQADFSQVAGPVGIVGMVGDAAAFGLTALLTFTAIISLNLAVINLLPFPALDGGRLVFVAIEAVSGRRIPPEWAGRINLVGFAILMLLMIAVTYNDISRLL